MLYLAGGMGRTMPESVWRPRFESAAAALRAAGFDVYNPAEHPKPSDEQGVHDGVCLISTPDIEGIALLHGWELSAGARTEAATACLLGKPARFVTDWLGEE